MVFKYLGISQMLWMGAKKLWEDLTYFAQYPLSILPENIIKTEVFSGVEARSGWILWMGASSSWRCSIKKLSVKISQYSQEKMCWSLLLTKLQAWRACYFINKRGQHRCFLFSCEYCKIFKYSYFWMGSKSFSLHYKVNNRFLLPWKIFWTCLRSELRFHWCMTEIQIWQFLVH